MSWKTEKRALRRKEQEAEEAARQEKQAECHHFDCTVVRWDFEGRPKLVRCDDCGAENHVEHYD